MLDDIFSENLVDTPDDIERVIEGGDNERQDASDAENNDEENKNIDESEKENKAKIKRKLGPRVNLNLERLVGPRGIPAMDSFFTDIKLEGRKGTEIRDLKSVMSRLEHWAFRMMPRMELNDCLQKIEKLGAKRQVVNYMKRVRLGLEEHDTGIISEVVENDIEDVDDPLAEEPTCAGASDTEPSRDQILRERIIHEDTRAARLARAQELKRKFQESQAKKLQESQSDCAEETQVKKLRTMGSEEENNGEIFHNNHENDVQLSQIEMTVENPCKPLLECRSNEFQESPPETVGVNQGDSLNKNTVENVQHNQIGTTEGNLSKAVVEKQPNEFQGIIYENARAARLAKAQELKKKFQESQAKKLKESQCQVAEEKYIVADDYRGETLLGNQVERVQLETTEENVNKTTFESQSNESQGTVEENKRELLNENPVEKEKDSLIEITKENPCKPLIESQSNEFQENQTEAEEVMAVASITHI